jgi:hypothetical protein
MFSYLLSNLKIQEKSNIIQMAKKKTENWKKKKGSFGKTPHAPKGSGQIAAQLSSAPFHLFLCLHVATYLYRVKRDEAPCHILRAPIIRLPLLPYL